MKTASILTTALIAISLMGCTELKYDYDVSQLVRSKYPNADVQIIYHSDGTRGLVVSFEVGSLSGLRRQVPFEKAHEIAKWMVDWPDNDKPWKDVTVSYKHSVLGKFLTISNTETVEISSLNSI